MNGYCSACGTFAWVESPTFWCKECGEAWIEEQEAARENRA